VQVDFIEASNDLDQQLERMWMLDMVPEPSHTPLSVNDKRVLKIWNESIKHKDGHYELAIPFKCRPPALPNNIAVAKQRLQSLKTRLSHNPELHRKYATYMKELIDKKYAEIADKEPECGRVWYLPHHSVQNVNKPDKG
jgi:hypothetical protein